MYGLGAIVLIFGLITYGCIAYYDAQDTVAKVQGEKITKTELQFFIAQVVDQMEKSSNLTDQASKKAFWNSKIEGQDAKAVAKDKALDKAKELKIQLIKAKEQSVTLSDGDINYINQTRDNIVQQAGSKTQADQNFMNSYGITVDQYMDVLKELMIVYKYMQGRAGAYKMTPEQLKSYYDKNMENANITTVIHILLSTVDANQKPLPKEKIAEKEKKAEDLLQKVKAGQNMKDLAKANSEDPGVKENEGVYTFSRGQMVKEFEDWAFKAKPGDSGIVKSSYGYHVIKKPTFEEIKDTNVKQALGQELYNAEVQKWKTDPAYNIVKNQSEFDKVIINR